MTGSYSAGAANVSTRGGGLRREVRLFRPRGYKDAIQKTAQSFKSDTGAGNDIIATIDFGDLRNAEWNLREAQFANDNVPLRRERAS